MALSTLTSTSSLGITRLERVSTQKDPLADVGELNYEQARDQLVDIVSRLETGGISLEESITLWERGEALAKRCEQWLEGAKERLDAARKAREE
jgi:exodeoxyribonuclease VII small subunit